MTPRASYLNSHATRVEDCPALERVTRVGRIVSSRERAFELECAMHPRCLARLCVLSLALTLLVACDSALPPTSAGTSSPAASGSAARGSVQLAYAAETDDHSAALYLTTVDGTQRQALTP